MKKDSAFTLIEVLVATSIIFMLVATVIPIDTILKQERMKLKEQREITLQLHDALQHYVWSPDSSPDPEVVFEEHKRFESVNEKLVHFQFTIENEWIKGCASWQNARDQQENICLYGLP